MVAHQIKMQGLSFNAYTPAAKKKKASLFSRTDQEFLPAIFDELKTEEGRQVLQETITNTVDENNVLKLFQPVQRTFNVALFEVFCDEPGNPRLDPKKIDSAGLLVRRQGENEKTKGKQPESADQGLEGWLQSGNKLRGWVKLSDRQKIVDPDAAKRGAELQSGLKSLDKKLALLRNPVEVQSPTSESVSPLFVAPPEVCEAAKKTILYALIPVTSNESSEAVEEPPGFEGAGFSSSDPIFRHMSKLLTNSSKRDYLWCDTSLSLSSLSDPEFVGTGTVGEEKSKKQKDWDTLISSLQQLLIEFDAFGESEESKSLYSAINEIKLPYKQGNGTIIHVNAAGILEKATDLLVNQDDTIGSINMPDEWPAINHKLKVKIWRAAKKALNKRVALINPGVGQFDELGRKYQIHAFVRVKQDSPCPPKLIWSEPSDFFTIAPWYEMGDVPPVRVSLPDVTDKNFLKKLKPSVAFSMPESLFNKMNGAKLDDLMDGKEPPSGPGIGLGWICGFNIPIITFCAFFVLSIFLSLFNFIFRWLLFVKICIPFPVKK